MTAKLKLRDDAARNPVTLIRRIVLRDPDMQSSDIHSLLESAGVRASPALVSMTASDLRQVIKLLDAEGLLIRSFDRERLGIEPDLVEVKPRSARPQKDSSRGRT